MSMEDNKAIVRRIYEEAWNRGEMAVVDEHVCADCFEHTDAGIGAGHVKQSMQYLRAAFPDIHFTLDQIVAEGDTVVVRWTLTGTHLGNFMGQPATGKPVRVEGIDMLRIVQGRVSERWAHYDGIALLDQIASGPVH